MSIKSLGNPTSSYNAVWGQTAKGAASAAPPGAFEATGGTTNTPGNGYKYHLFDYPNSDNFVVTNVSGTPGIIEVLVVGGGGGGGNGGGAGGGGGGAGGVRNFPITLSAAATYPVSVGAGGDSLAYDGAKGPGQGGDSAFNSPGGNSITKVVGSGGGAAGTYGEWGAGNLKAGIPGGSGGGQGTYPGGHTTPQATAVASPDGRPTAQGNSGGYAGSPASGVNAGSGGGGAGGAGQNATSPDSSGTGGPGSPFPAFAYPLAFPAPMLPAFATPTNAVSGYVASPTSDHYGGGGGGSQGQGPTPIGFVDGGTGGGGSGVNRYGPQNPPGDSTQGVDGLGGGGGGTAAGNETNTGPGGNGVVIIRYEV